MSEKWKWTEEVGAFYSIRDVDEKDKHSVFTSYELPGKYDAK